MTGDLERKAALLGTKYCKPGINSNSITRQRIHEKLHHSLGCRLTTVVAPAGYGKTTAVLDWLEKSGLPAAWLSLDVNDNNPAVFWRYLCTALDSISDGVGKDTEYVFSSPELLKANIQINILVDSLAEIQSDFLLVLDDLHLIDEPSILEGLSYLIDYLPPKMHLILISRAEPSLTLQKYRIKWQSQRLTQDDLLFREEEIFQFYEARGITLENTELRKVEDFTEGWAAALVAVTLTMEESGGHNAIQALSRSVRNFGQYLRDEVVGNWPPERLSFAMKTSILDTLSEDLCNAVTGSYSGKQMLKEIYEKSGFLQTLDGQGQAYRYHYLLRNFLMELLHEFSPEEIPRLYEKAGIWFEEQGFVPEAVESFLNGTLYQQAYELIEHRVDYLINKKENGRLLSWIERLPSGYRESSFKIAVIYTMYYAEIGQYDLSRYWLGRMKAVMESGPYASIPEWIGYCRTVCKMAEANLLLCEGNPEFLPLVFTAAETDGGRFYKMPEYNDFNTADIYFYRCPIGCVTALLRDKPERYGKMIESYRGMISKNPGYAPLGIGEFLYESNRLDEAAPYLLNALEEAKDANCAGVIVPALVDLARLKRAVGDISGAFGVLEECERLLQDGGKPHWNYLIRAFRCRLYLDAGNTEKVRGWFDASKLTIFTELNRIREFELLVYARVLIFLDRSQDAELLLQRLLAFTGENRRLHSRAEVLNLLAMLAFSNHQVRRAYTYLDESFDIGTREGYVRSYLDENSTMAQLIRAYIKSRGKRQEEDPSEERPAYASNILKQMQGSLLKTLGPHGAAPVAAAERITSQLTEQEKKVLELIVNASTNKEIGEKLGISIRTVKTHTGNIYGKLGLKNRAQCVKLIREAKIL